METATRAARRMRRSYRTPPHAIYDHFRSAGHLHALETHALQRLQEIGPACQPWEPRGENDDVVWTRFADEPDDAVLALTPIRQDLGRDEPHEVDDLPARHPRNCPDV